MKLVLLKRVFSYVKVLLRLCLPDMSQSLFRAFKWDTLSVFVSSGIKITESQIKNSKQKRAFLLSKFRKLKIWYQSTTINNL